MFSFFRRKPKEFLITKPISNCIRSLLAYRIRKDTVFRSELIANGVHLEHSDDIVTNFSIEQLRNTPECYIVYLIAQYCNLERLADDNYNYKDVLYTIDQGLPKPKGYLPVELWSPHSLLDYILYRIHIDYDPHYPSFVIRDKLDETKSFLTQYLKEHGSIQ